MTSRELLALVVRRWYLLVAGAVLGLAVLWLVLHRPGVYWTQYNVVLLAPTYADYPNQLEDPHYALSPMAGILVSDWNGGRRPIQMASSDTTLYGEGARDGIKLQLPNSGTQWKPLYYSSAITVQIVGSDARDVARKAALVRADLDSLLTKRQDELGVPQSMRMTTIQAPAVPAVQYISGSRPRTVLAVGIVAAALTITAIYWLERRRPYGWTARIDRSPSATRAANVHQPQPEASTVG